MADVGFIVKHPVLDKSQDYAFLRAEGVAHLQALGHRLWTDHNIHDPGITMLEALCYAITDLGLRAGYDIKDILTTTDRGVAINPAQFHTALEVMTCNPVTFDDLRKLLIDIPGVRSAWIEIHKSVTYWLEKTKQRLTDGPVAGPGGELNPPLNGLYDVLLEHQEFVRDSRSLRVGRRDGTSGAGDFIPPGGRGLRFHASYDLTLLSVSVYPDAAGEVTITLVGATGAPQVKTVQLDKAGQENRVRLGFRVPAGEGYRLEASGTGINLFRATDPVFPYSIEHVIHFVSGSNGPQVLPSEYFFFYDWEVSYAAPPPVHYRVPWNTTAVGPEDNAGPGGYVAAQDSGIAFEALRDLVLTAVHVYAEIPGTVTVRLLDAAGNALQSATGKVGEADTKTRIDLNFDVAGGRTYRLDADATVVRLFRGTVASYPDGQDNVIRLLAGHPSAGEYYFFYDWQVSYPSQPQPSTITRADVALAARNRLHAHRNLCEDLVNLCDLDNEEIAVCADIAIAPGADVEALLAEMFYRIGRHISPGVRFYSIDELLKRGKTTDQIFEGPKLDHGFIDDDEFQALKRKCEIRTSDIVREIMAIEGILAVKTISLLSFIDGQLRLQEPWILTLATDKFRAPVFSPDRSKIVFYKNDLPYFADRNRVDELLTQKKAADTQLKLKGHQTDLPVPVGVDRDLADYYPIQNELPATYRVGRIRVPESEGERRIAQSRQLKAYLMFFEQLLANYLAQLAHVRDLFSWEAGADATYFTQAVTGIADRSDIYIDDAGLDGNLGTIIEDTETAQERRGRFLDHLIARFAESFTDYSLLMFSLANGLAPDRVMEDKRLFLEDHPALSADRGKAYDYRYPADPANLSGYQRRIYRLLGIRDVARRDLAGHRFAIEEVGGEWRFVLKDENGATLFESIRCESRRIIEVLLDFALGLGDDPDNYRFDAVNNVHRLMRFCDDPADDAELGKTTAADVLDEVVAYFATHGNAEGCHVVEHILLRKRTKVADPYDLYLPVQLNDPDECSCVEVKEPYSFRMTVLLPSWSPRFQALRFRHFVEETLRREAPAHIYSRICWISHAQMLEFEQDYDTWCAQLAILDAVGVDCRSDAESDEDVPLTGELPLPPNRPELDPFNDALRAMIARLHNLDNVYPLARLHDCEDAGGDAPPVTLNNTSLGTF